MRPVQAVYQHTPVGDPYHGLYFQQAIVLQFLLVPDSMDVNQRRAAAATTSNTNTIGRYPLPLIGLGIMLKVLHPIEHGNGRL